MQVNHRQNQRAVGTGIDKPETTGRRCQPFLGRDSVFIKRMALNPDGEFVVKQFKAVPIPDDLIMKEDVLALAGSVLDLAQFMGAP
jgi:hypothetical protein